MKSNNYEEKDLKKIKKKKKQKGRPLSDQIKGIALLGVSLSRNHKVPNREPLFLRTHLLSAAAAAHRHLRHLSLINALSPQK